MKVFVLLLFLTISYSYAESSYSAVTWNIRFKNSKDSLNGNAWEKRLPHIQEFLKFKKFDIIALQEPDSTQINDLEISLADYQFVKYDSLIEHPILLKKDFKILDKGVFWLSATPSTKGKSWDSGQIRFCNWVKIETDIDELFIFNVHFDNKGKLARENSARLLLKEIPKITNTSNFIILGDFNLSRKELAYQILTKKNIFINTEEIVQKKYQSNGSYNYFDPNKKSPWIMDYIFIPQTLIVSEYEIFQPIYHDGKQWRFPSDHNPIGIKFSFTKKISK